MWLNSYTFRSLLFFVKQQSPEEVRRYTRMNLRIFLAPCVQIPIQFWTLHDAFLPSKHKILKLLHFFYVKWNKAPPLYGRTNQRCSFTRFEWFRLSFSNKAFITDGSQSFHFSVDAFARHNDSSTPDGGRLILQKQECSMVHHRPHKGTSSQFF